ncbi:hypothetical protein QL285_085783 [Trifolium repens]|nr:hypothetical protein QL285_085783 [Trifolium repens]
MVNVTLYARRVLNQPIKSFHLICHDNTRTALDVVWLINAAERGIEYLDVHLPDTRYFHCRVFNFRNLIVLKLKGIYFSIFVSTHLPLFRTLHLNKEYFFEHGYEYDEECKSLPNLVKADICNLSAFDVHLKACYNVKFRRLEKLFGCVPLFSNLTHLEIIYGRSINWNFIFQVLKNCPILQSFLLDMPTSTSLLGMQPDLHHSSSNIYYK